MFKVAIESGCPVQPAMIRYTRHGKLDPNVSFIGGESFVVNILRIMGRPSARAELKFFESFETEGQPRKELARRAEILVRQGYEESGS